MASHLPSWCPAISPQPLRPSGPAAQAQLCNVGEAHSAETFKKETQQCSLDSFLDFIRLMQTVLYLT